jgi:hypothetical protein
VTSVIDETGMQSALQTILESFSPNWSTKKLGFAFTPGANAPWQRGTLILGEPMPVAFGQGVYSRLQCIYQIDLFYPVGATALLFARQKLVRDYFWPANQRGKEIVTGTGTININKRPELSGLIEKDPVHNQVFVQVFFYADQAPPA